MKTKLGLLLVMLSLAVWCDDSTDAEQPTDPNVVYKHPPIENKPESTVTDWTNRRFNRAVAAATKAQQRSDDRSQRLLENPKNPDPYKQRPATGEPEIESITNTLGMTLHKIPAGSFIMGANEGRGQHNEQQHKVTITKPFYMQTTEVTQGQWKAVIDTEPWKDTHTYNMGSWKEGPNYPATSVNWDNAIAYCKKLSEKEGKTYRLPTEAEWEYACRAGTQTTWSCGNAEKILGDYAWYNMNTSAIGEGYAHQVGLKTPNAFGLYDMHGNAGEWCSDYYNQDYFLQSPEKDPQGPASGSWRVIRGGTWGNSSFGNRSAWRNWHGNFNRYGYAVGFRVVRELDAPRRKDPRRTGSTTTGAKLPKLAQRQSYISDMLLIQRVGGYTKNPVHIQKPLDRHQNSEFKGFEWHYWNRVLRPDLLLRDNGSIGGRVSPVFDSVFSPDGKNIATVALRSPNRSVLLTSDQIIIWDAETGEETIAFGNSPNNRCVAFSPDGKTVVTGGETPTVWDAKTGQEIHRLTGHSGIVSCVAFSPDGKWIVSGSRDNTIKIWDTETRQETHTLTGHSGPVWSVAYSPDGKRIVSGSIDKTLKIWDPETGQETHTLIGHSGIVLSVAFSPDGKRIVSGSNDNTLKIWDAETGHETYTLKGHASPTRCVAFSPDAKRIVSGSGAWWREDGEEIASGRRRDCIIRIWDAETGRETHTLSGHSGLLYSVAFSPDGKRVVSGSGDGTARVWDVGTGQETHRLVRHTDRILSVTLKGHQAEVYSVNFSPDGKRIVSGSYDRTLKVWEEVIEDQIGRLERLTRATLTLRGYSDEDNPFVRPDPEVKPMPNHSDNVYCVAFSPDGKRVVSGGFDKALKIWDAETGQQTHTLTGHSDHVRSVVFSPDGKRIVTGSHDHTLKIWDAETGHETHTLKGHTNSVTCGAYSPDGKWIVSGSLDKTLKIWDAETGLETLTVTGHSSRVLCVAFSADGKRIVSGSGDGMARVWDAKTGQETFLLKGHASSVYSVAFSPDGKRIVSGSSDSTVRIWDTVTGQETLTLTEHSGPVWSVAFSPDGNRIVSGSSDKTLKIWDARPTNAGVLPIADER